MKIAIIGYGKMGHLVEEIALQKEHSIVLKIDSKLPQKKLDRDFLKMADVCIDFSHPRETLNHILAAAKAKVNLVMGTTGWYEHLDVARQIVEDHNIGFLYAPNFSIGFNIFYKIVSAAATLMNAFDQYDVAGIEYHHNQKQDIPSGTAEALSKILLNKIERKKKSVYNLDNRKIDGEELQFTSVRCGSIPGTHTVLFDSPADTITLTHEARNRNGFAAGAITAAEWLEGKQGFYTFDDVLGDF